jgi:xanthine dehydrogenase accessory factor
VVRGLTADGYEAKVGLKVGDIDPRAAAEHCHSISDKALAIGGGVLQAILELRGGIGTRKRERNVSRAI